MSDWQKLKALSATELLLLSASCLILPVVALLLKQRGFSKTERLLSRFSANPSPDSDAYQRVRRTSRVMSIAAVRGPYKAKCLEQAVTLWWMLGLMGIVSTIRLGIFKKDEAIEAHAWVVHDDEIVLGELADLESYTPLLDVNFERR